jgi:hypothetical protein
VSIQISNSSGKGILFSFLSFFFFFSLNIRHHHFYKERGGKGSTCQHAIFHGDTEVNLQGRNAFGSFSSPAHGYGDLPWD